MKISSNRVMVASRKTYEIEIPENEVDRERARAEIMLLVRHEYDISAQDDELYEFDGKYVFDVGESITGRGYNTEIYPDVVTADSLLDRGVTEPTERYYPERIKISDEARQRRIAEEPKNAADRALRRKETEKLIREEEVRRTSRRLAARASTSKGFFKRILGS